MIKTALHFLYYLFYVATYGNSHKHNRTKYMFITFIWNFQFIIASILVIKYRNYYSNPAIAVIMATLICLILPYFIGKYFSNRERYVAIVNQYRKFGEGRVIVIRIIVLLVFFIFGFSSIIGAIIGSKI